MSDYRREQYRRAVGYSVLLILFAAFIVWVMEKGLQ